MGLLEIPWNAVSVSSLVIVLGLGLDYGVFVLEGSTRDDRGAAAYAVTLSALTTAAGFGVLLMARSPALYTVGLAVLVGMGAALACALVLVPPLARREALLGGRMGAVAKWAAALALIGVNLDHLGLLVAYNAPPPAPSTPTWTRDDVGPHDRRVGNNRLLFHEGIWSQYLEGGGLRARPRQRLAGRGPAEAAGGRDPQLPVRATCRGWPRGGPSCAAACGARRTSTST